MKKANVSMGGIGLCLIAVMVLLLSGCLGLFVGGLASGAYMAHDSRTMGTMMDDERIELLTGSALSQDSQLGSSKMAHIDVTSYDNIVLLTGEVANDELRQRAVNIAAGIDKVKKVYDELVVAPPSSLMSRAGDTALTAKVKTALVGTVDPTRIKVVTERGVVYLMGIVSPEDGNKVAEVVRHLSGVAKVVKLFEYGGRRAN